MQSDTVEAIFGIAVLIVVGIAVYLGSSYNCSSKYEDSGIKSDFGVFSGCRIHIDGKWIPEDRWRAVE